jgi:hypothetical protein
VDELASDTQELLESENLPPKYDYLQGEIGQVFTGNNKVYKQIDKNIRNIIAEQIMPAQWHKYKRVQREWFHEVDWRAMKKAMDISSTMIRLWILKRCAKDCGAHAILKRRREREDDFCPFCSQEETVEHVYRCQHIKVQELWNLSIAKLEKFLTDLHTDPNIIIQLIDGLHQWRLGTSYAATQMVIDQNAIGWLGILEGILGKHWGEEQTLYKEQDNLATSGQKWAHLVIRRLWKIAWELWQHRNKEAHKNDTSIQLENLLQQVRQEMERGTQGIQSLQI